MLSYPCSKKTIETMKRNHSYCDKSMDITGRFVALETIYSQLSISKTRSSSEPFVTLK